MEAPPGRLLAKPAGPKRSMKLTKVLATFISGVVREAGRVLSIRLPFTFVCVCVMVLTWLWVEFEVSFMAISPPSVVLLDRATPP
jgi:hypothetical protein